MKIRSITCCADPGNPIDPRRLDSLGSFIGRARPAFEAAGYVVQSTRLATIPLSDLVHTHDPGAAVHLAQELERQSALLGFDYLSLGPASAELVVPVLAATQTVFTAGIMANENGVSLEAVRDCARIIYQAAPITPDGFTNLRFAAMANVQPGTPLFPAAYHGGGAAKFALAMEAADLAIQAVEESESLAQARDRLVRQVERHAHELVNIASQLSRTEGIEFSGIDFTLAPFPEELSSFGTAIERLGVPAVGLHGSLAAAAFLVDALDRARFQRAGFNGLLLPVLEDFTLARRAGEGSLGIKDLLLYSTVCGTGLDTIPLPGDASEEQLFALLLDVAVLSQRLAKPLTARLLPVPGKNAGEWTEFDFPYFANSRILRLEAEPLGGLLAGREILDLRPRRAFEIH